MTLYDAHVPYDSPIPYDGLVGFDTFAVPVYWHGASTSGQDEEDDRRRRLERFSVSICCELYQSAGFGILEQIRNSAGLEVEYDPREQPKVEAFKPIANNNEKFLLDSLAAECEVICETVESIDEPTASLIVKQDEKLQGTNLENNLILTIEAYLIQ